MTDSYYADNGRTTAKGDLVANQEIQACLVTSGRIFIRCVPGNAGIYKNKMANDLVRDIVYEKMVPVAKLRCGWCFLYPFKKRNKVQITHN